VSAVQGTAAGIDFGNADVDGLEKYDGAVKLDKSNASPEDKIRSWEALAKSRAQFADTARARATEWRRFRRTAACGRRREEGTGRGSRQGLDRS